MEYLDLRRVRRRAPHIILDAKQPRCLLMAQQALGPLRHRRYQPAELFDTVEVAEVIRDGLLIELYAEPARLRFKEARDIALLLDHRGVRPWPVEAREVRGVVHRLHKEERERDPRQSVPQPGGAEGGQRRNPRLAQNDCERRFARLFY